MPQQQVINLNQTAIQVMVDTPDGKKAFVTAQPKARITLEEGAKVNANWFASATKIQVNNLDEGDA